MIFYYSSPNWPKYPLQPWLHTVAPEDCNPPLLQLPWHSQIFDSRSITSFLVPWGLGVTMALLLLDSRYLNTMHLFPNSTHSFENNLFTPQMPLVKARPVLWGFDGYELHNFVKNKHVSPQPSFIYLTFNFHPGVFCHSDYLYSLFLNIFYFYLFSIEKQ